MSDTYVSTAPTTNYGIKASAGTMGILLHNDKVLIIRRRLKNRNTRQDGPPDTWAFPGGSVDEDETPEMCIVREMKEELGVDVAIKLVGDESVWAVTDDNVDDKLWRCNFFILKQTDPKQEAQIREPHKHCEIQWIQWKTLWAEIKADIEGRGEVSEAGRQEKPFFPSMKNLVERYPRRNDPSCLYQRLA
ncbi:NUDIX hydrolase domain-like protein [Bipolaris maydis]|nr:NUDIX hydrolase domain-like protein [Bipolaris maydis]